MTQTLEPVRRSDHAESGFAIAVRAWRMNNSLRLATLALIGLFICSVVGLVVDDRTLLGDPVWLKPAKFAISSAIYAVSMMMVLAIIGDHPRLVRNASAVTAAALVIEVVLIAVQASRGVRSHFNFASTFDIAVVVTMGLSIVALWLCSVVVLVALFRQTFENPARGTLLRWALLITVIGSGLGGIMTAPRSGQAERVFGSAAMSSAEKDNALEGSDGRREIGAHSVGVADGGKGLAVVGWSTEGGDLRIGHFLGMHALQLLTAAGLIALRYTRGRSLTQQTRLVHVLSSGYLAAVFVVSWQALRSEPLGKPGTITVVGVALILAWLVIGSGVALALNDLEGRGRDPLGSCHEHRD